MQVVLQEQPDHRMRRHQVDLKAAVLGEPALLFERGEFRVRLLGDVGIKQIAEGDVLHRLSGFQPVADARRAGGMNAEQLVRFLQRRIVGEDRLEPGDPVGALAGLAVGNALEPRAERGADGLEHLA